MIAHYGRAIRNCEQAVGRLDPGATAGMLQIDAFLSAVHRGHVGPIRFLSEIVVCFRSE